MKKRISKLDRYLATNFGYGTHSFSTKELILFSEKLLAQIRRHQTIPEALETIFQTTGERTLRMMLMSMATHVQSGTPLSQAMLTFKDVFPRYYIATIMATERSGKIDKGLEAIIRLLKNDRRIAEYTGLIQLYLRVIIYNIAIAVVILFFQIGVIKLTVNSVLIACGSLIVVILISGFIKQYFTSEKRRHMLENMLFKIPAVGRLYLLVKISRFCYLFDSFQQSGVPFIQNVELLSTYMNCVACDRDLELIHQGLKNDTKPEGILKTLDLFPETLAKELFLYKTGDTKVDSIRNYSFYISDEISEISLSMISILKSTFLWFSLLILGWVYLLIILKL